ncbi:MAG: flagellar filament capping protein FliD, partial [Deltaproteobacteria bacterium]|nr:flagellar filament capping protein FliD [Deltaproteobacteria bacterium]
GTLEFVDGDLAFGAGAARKREIIAGEDAVVEIDGVEVTSASNTLSDVIQGVTLTLVGEDAETTVNLNISHDVEAIQQKIESFVNSYNVIMSYINEQFTYDQEKSEPGGILFGDNTLSSVKSEITSLITGSVWGVTSSFSVLSSLGITMENDLILSIDENLLGDRIQSNFNDVTAFFVGQGSASGSLLGYVSHGAETQSGAYSVNIQRAAAKASQSGSVDLSAGGAGEVLRISSGSNTATILLTSGMTIDDIVAEINTETASDYAQTIVGDESLYADPGQSSAITATTTWNSLYRSDGSKLLFENGNVISFAGTTRSGAEVEGAYAIENVETDTIQGLLSAIEAAFSSSVVASVDTEGRLVVADKYTGASRLAIDDIWDETETSLFGVIDADEEAGDGSKTGRYALAVTASQDDSGRLVITADDYGRGGITITQDSSDNNYNQIIYSSTRSATVASSGTTDITAETVWSDIFGAGVVDGDTITISGKARDGVTDISGVYAVSDSGVDTVDGLLAAIEAAFAAEGTTVNAFLLDGMITVEDGIAGISLISLSLACNNEGGGSLDFGTVSQSTERDLDLGLINGTYYGLDVAGTIGGEPATGSGQFLRGNDGNVNTAGLSLLYRGSSSNADAGTITITNGMGELFFRTLSYITDSDDGYVTFKQQSLNSSIKGKQERIDEMEAALERKAELMINRFVAMELLLGKLQNQSNWLEGQLSAAYSAWK